MENYRPLRGLDQAVVEPGVREKQHSDRNYAIFVSQKRVFLKNDCQDKAQSLITCSDDVPRRARFEDRLL